MGKAMSKVRIIIKPDGSFKVIGHSRKGVNAAAIVGMGLKVCEEMLAAEDKMLEEDLKR